ncbi:hypothetical protein B6V00_02135 [ANME-1 cluster archaeon ex4572_4]|nr:hypothetical protein [Methanophagales archaeon]OYT66988.1 MAG: hypothetical protein B6V00_02135 [ANME-1 cluster archaeon ex4572_4]PXF51157.1 MAG: hypothetical protein C4B55_01735 [Methanophagales archaeon]
MRKVKVRLPNGQEIEAMDVDFETVKEDWNEYKLEDGTVLRFKTIVSSIIRTENYDPMTGDPVYHVRSTNVLRVKVPPEMKRLPAGTAGGKKSGAGRGREGEGVEVG